MNYMEVCNMYLNAPFYNPIRNIDVNRLTADFILKTMAEISNTSRLLVLEQIFITFFHYVSNSEKGQRRKFDIPSICLILNNVLN